MSLNPKENSGSATPPGKRILFFTKFPPPFTGQNVGTLLTFQMLERQGARLKQINTSFDFLRPSSSKVAMLKYIGTYSIRTFSLLSEAWREVRRNRYDALYFLPSSSVLGQLKDAASMLVVGKKIPKVVGHIRNGNYGDCFNPGFRRKLGKYIVSRVDTFIFLSPGLGERVSEFIPESKRTVVMNPIDPEMQIPEPVAQDKIARLKDAPVFRILFLSNMIKTKGYEDLLRAAPLLLGKIDFEMHFVGGWLQPADQREFEAEVERLGVASVVFHHGTESSRPKVRQHYLDAHAFVLPTYYPNEAQPRSIIEAMAAATPIVATRHASIPEYVNDGQEGFLVATKSPEEIAEALLKLSDRQTWPQFAARSRQRYVDFFSPQRLHAQLSAVLGVPFNPELEETHS